MAAHNPRPPTGESEDATAARITPISFCSSLVRLDLSRNHITSLAPLAHLQTLREVDARYNAITRITDLRSLSRLESLRLEANKIDSLNALVLDLREGFPLLHRLDLRCLNDEDANPVCSNESYHASKLREAAKCLKIVDGRRAHEFYDIYEDAARAAATLDGALDVHEKTASHLPPPMSSLKGIQGEANAAEFQRATKEIEKTLARARADLMGSSGDSAS